MTALARIRTLVPRFGGAAREAGIAWTSHDAYPLALGLAALAILLAVYLGLLTALSGWPFTLEQLASYWYYILPLSAGFGVQVGLYTRLRQVVGRNGPGRAVVATSGTTSTVAMVSCCAHYLVNILPVLGATGLVALAAQYQVEFFWVGLVANGAGIAFIATKLFGATREHAHGAVPATNEGSVMAKDPVCGITLDVNNSAGAATYQEAAMETDPVCGMQVDPKRAAERRYARGRTYYFCSTGCAAKFDKHPPQYT